MVWGMSVISVVDFLAILSWCQFCVWVLLWTRDFGMVRLWWFVMDPNGILWCSVPVVDYRFPPWVLVCEASWSMTSCALSKVFGEVWKCLILFVRRLWSWRLDGAIKSVFLPWEFLVVRVYLLTCCLSGSLRVAWCFGRPLLALRQSFGMMRNCFKTCLTFHVFGRTTTWRPQKEILEGWLVAKEGKMPFWQVCLYLEVRMVSWLGEYWPMGGLACCRVSCSLCRQNLVAFAGVWHMQVGEVEDVFCVVIWES